MESKEKEAKKKQEEEEMEMRKRSEKHAENSTGIIYTVGQDKLARSEMQQEASGGTWIVEEALPKGGKKLAKKKHGNKKTKNTEIEGGSGKQQSNVRPQGMYNPKRQVPNRFAILYHDVDEEKDEIDRGKSAIEACLDSNKGMVDSSTTMVESDKFLLEPANPGFPYSVTRLGQYSVQDGLEHETCKSATPLTKKKADEVETCKSAAPPAKKKADEEMADKAETCKSATPLAKKKAEGEMTDEAETCKSATALAKKADEEMAEEAESFASYRRGWECSWSKTCGFFKDITVLSSMQFTHYTPGIIPLGSAGATPKTLQILSLKLKEIAGGLELPLSVYGVVAARDIVDRNRNILFYCNRNQAQELKQIDTPLCLMGPSRAIVFKEEVDFEIELEAKGTPLICCARKYKRGYGSSVSTICSKNRFCTLQLYVQPVKETVQATILGVKVAKVKGSWPLKYGCIISCYPQSGEVVFTNDKFSRITNTSYSKIVLLDSKCGAMQKGFDGHVHLSRQVVSVEFGGGLDVVIQAYSKSGGIAAKSRVHFTPQKSNISQQESLLGGAQVAITVAWSLVPTDKMDIQLGVGGMRVA